MQMTFRKRDCFTALDSTMIQDTDHVVNYILSLNQNTEHQYPKRNP